MKSRIRIVLRSLSSLAAPLTLLCAVSFAAQTPFPGQYTGKPRFSLTITLSQDAIRGDAEIPLEIVMTNTSAERISYGAELASPLWMHLCALDVRDPDGKQLEQKPIPWPPGHLGVTSGILVTLNPGEEVRTEILLSRVYNLNTPGKYTIQAMERDGSNLVKSNVVTLTMGNAISAKHRAKPPVSVTLTAAYNSLRAGYRLPITVAVKNTSRKVIALRTWQPQSFCSSGFPETCDFSEFGSGVAVRDSAGSAAQLTKEGHGLEEGKILPAGSFSLVSLKPGETYEDTMIVGTLFDLGRPGSYVIQLALFDPATGLTVKSNPLSVAVNSGDQKPQPPFLIHIRHTGEFFWTSCPSRENAYFRFEVTNLSDHAIGFDAAPGGYNLNVYDDRGLLMPLDETSAKYYRGPLPRNKPNAQATRDLQPGESTNETVSLSPGYDLPHDRSYTVQIEAFDVETISVVESNLVTFEMDKKSQRIIDCEAK